MVIQLIIGIVSIFVLLVAVLLGLYILSPTMVEIKGRGLVEYISINVINDSDKDFEEIKLFIKSLMGIIMNLFKETLLELMMN